MAFELFSLIGEIAINGLDKLKGDLSAFESKLKTIGPNIKDVEAATKTWNDKVQAISGGLRVAGGALTAIGAATVAFGVAAVSTATDFEAGMNRVKGLTGETGEAFEGLRDLAKELGATTQFTARQATDAMGFMAQAGLKTNEIMGGLPRVLELAAASGLDLASSADVVTNIMSGFRLETGQLAEVNDVLVQAMTSANTNLTQLGQALKFAGPVASGVGLAFNESVAAISKLGDAGIQGALAGTTLRSALSTLINPTKQASEKLDELGKRIGQNTIVTTDASGKMLPLVDILKQLEKSGASTADLMELFGIKAGPGMSVLLEVGSEALAEFTKELDNSGGRAKEVADTNMEGLKGAFLGLQSAFEGLQIALIESGFGKLIEDIIRKVTGFVQELAKANPKLLAIGGTIAAVFGGLAAVLGPILFLLPIFASSITSIVTFITGAGGLTAAIGSVTSIFTGPFTAALGGVTSALGSGGILGAIEAVIAVLGSPVVIIGAIVAALVIWREEITEFVVGVGVWIAEMLEWDGTINGLVDGAFNVLMDAFRQIGEWLGLSPELARAFAQGAVGTITKSFQLLISGISAVIKAVGNFAGEAIDFAVGGLKRLGEWIGFAWDKLAGFVNFFRTKGREAMKSGADGMEETSDAAKKAADGTIKLSNETEKLVEQLQENADALIESERNLDEYGKGHSRVEEKVKKTKKKIEEFHLLLSEKESLALKGWSEKLGIAATSVEDIEKKLKSMTPAVAAVEGVTQIAADAITENWTDINTSIQTVLGSLDEAAAFINRTEEAFNNLGIKTPDQLRRVREQAEQDFEIIKNSGMVTAEALDIAWAKMTEARKAELESMGQKLPEAEQKALDKILAAQRAHAKDSKDIFTTLKNQVSTIITDFGKSVTDVIFSFFSRGKFNADLDKQAEELEQSLAKRLRDFEDFTEDVNDKLAVLNEEYAEQVYELENEFTTSVENQEQAFRDFVSNAADDFREFSERLAREEEETISNLVERIREATEKYTEFELESLEKVSKAREKSERKLFESAQDREDDLKKKERDLKQFEVDARTKRARERERAERKLNERIADLQERGTDEAIREIERLRREFTDAQRAEDQELEDSLAIRRREYQDYVDDTALELQRLEERELARIQEIEEEERQSRERRKQELEEFAEDQKAKIDEVKQRNAERLAEEEAKLQESITNQENKLEEFKIEAIAKLEEKKEAAKQKFAEEEAALAESLAKQKSAIDEFTETTKGKLQEIADKHRTIFGDLAGAFKDIFLGENGLAGVITRFVTEFITNKIIAELTKIVDVVLPSVSNAFKTVFGLTGEVAGTVVGAGGEIAGTVAGAGGEIAGTVGSAGGAGGAAAAGGLASAAAITGIVTGIASAVTGIIGVFQTKKTNEKLTLIEENTRFTQIVLGASGRSDQGILGVLFRILGEVEFGNGVKAVERIRDISNDTMYTVRDALANISEQVTWGNLVKANEQSRDALEFWLPGIGLSLEEIATARPNVNITIPSVVLNNELDVQQVARQIAREVAGTGNTLNI